MTAKKKTPAAPAADIIANAMLVNVRIRMWEGRKHDRAVTDDTTARARAEREAGRFNKNLFGGKTEELAAVLAAAGRLRLTHYQHTLPWSDDGWRLLPTANYMQYTDAMRAAQVQYRDAVDTFIQRYPALVEAAQGRLGAMYKEEDYPAAASIQSRFQVAVEYTPLPAGSDFRVNLPAAELRRVALEVEQRVQDGLRNAMEDAYRRLGDAIVQVREKLDDGKYLRDSTLNRLREVADSLGRLNLTGDPVLEDARSRVLMELGSFDAEMVRADEGVRQAAARHADSILQQMAGLYTPAAPTEEGAA